MAMIEHSLKAIALSAALLASTAAAQEPMRGISALEAQELTAQELANRTLGDIGALVIDVDRPEWGSDPGAWARRRGLSPPSVPSLFYELAFYARPEVSSFGMCQQLVITVHFARAESVGARQLPDRIRTEVRYGVVGELTPPEGQTPSSYLETLRPVCANQPAGRDYFPADGGGDADYAARISHHLTSLGQARETPSFRFTCRTFNQPCRDANATLRLLDWRQIRSIDRIPCTAGEHSVRYPRCYNIVYGITMSYGRRAHTLGYNTLYVVAGTDNSTGRGFTIESADVRFDSAVP